MSRLAGNVLLSLGAVCLVVLLTELVGHALIKPAPMKYGTFLGRELPPFRVVPSCEPPPSPEQSASGESDITVDGRPLTIGDLNGIDREDPVLGYAPKENAASANGWWQSNNLGARDRRDASALPDSGTRRIVVFGESFGAGSRVRQEQTWSAELERATPRAEVLNFAVDGYSMAQAYLRFLQLRSKIGFDLAVMVFVPKPDLARDINVYRPLLASGWRAYTVLPRFVVEHGELVLAARPDESAAAFIAANCASISDRLRAHLAKYDRFYFDAEYRDGSPLLRNSLLYKLGVISYANSLRKRLARGLMRQDSEAVEVSKAIFWQMDEDVREDGGKFVLVLLPIESELKRLAAENAYRRQWHGIVSSICGKPLVCVDLAGYLPGLPSADIDRGYDGSHYGPITNRLIGDFIARELTRQGILRQPPQKVGEYRQ